MKAVQIRDNIYWVGAIDWNIRNFHGYSTQNGTTYNAYLIIDKKITLIDAVKKEFSHELLARISSIIDPEKIDYVISNHVEMDHSGALPEIMAIAKNAVLYTSNPAGAKGLNIHFHPNWQTNPVKSGDTLNTGKFNFKFIQTPMIHWPDNMVTYLEEEKILFSNDAFGQHIASSERFNTEKVLGFVLHEAKKYYANIVLPYGEQVQRALSVLQNFDIKIIAPSHGLIWQDNLDTIIKEYDKWSKYEAEEYALIIYDTMWGSTEKIAKTIEAAFNEKRIKTALFNLRFNHISDIITQVMTAKYICLGSPTLNMQILPTVGGFLTYLKGLKPRNKTVLAFGSYGWASRSIDIIEEEFRNMEYHVLPSIRVNYVPTEEELKKIEEGFSF